MIYYTIALLLLSGCTPDLIEYKPTSWPRTIVMESALETDEEIAHVEQVRRSIAILNKSVGAAVYQLAVTNDASAAGCDTLQIAYVDQVMNNDGTPRPGVRATYISDFWPCKAYIQMKLNGRLPPDETVVVHELMHDLLGGQHDEVEPFAETHSVFAVGVSCFADDPSVGYSRKEHCSRQVDEITPDLINRIRKVMKL